MFIILSNARLLKSQVIEATEQEGAFVEQPQPALSNSGSLSLSSQGTFLGEGTPPDLTITIREAAGNVGAAKFTYSSDGGITEYGANADVVFTQPELVTEGI